MKKKMIRKTPQVSVSSSFKWPNICIIRVPDDKRLVKGRGHGVR